MRHVGGWKAQKQEWPGKALRTIVKLVANFSTERTASAKIWVGREPAGKCVWPIMTIPYR